MKKTKKDQHIIHEVNGIDIKRFGFKQNMIFINDATFGTNEKLLKKYIEAIESY